MRSSGLRGVLIFPVTLRRTPTKSACLEGRPPGHLGRLLRGSLRSHLRMTDYPMGVFEGDRPGASAASFEARSARTSG